MQKNIIGADTPYIQVNTQIASVIDRQHPLTLTDEKVLNFLNPINSVLIEDVKNMATFSSADVLKISIFPLISKLFYGVISNMAKY